MRRMRFPYMRTAAPDILATAKAQRWDPAEVLRVLLAEEVRGRDEATRAMRRKTSAPSRTSITPASHEKRFISPPAAIHRPGRPQCHEWSQ